jgi:hypothetical protein
MVPPLAESRNLYHHRSATGGTGIVPRPVLQAAEAGFFSTPQADGIAVMKTETFRL